MKNTARLLQFVDASLARWIYMNPAPASVLIKRLSKYEISEQGVDDIQAGRTWTSATRDLQPPPRGGA